MNVTLAYQGHSGIAYQGQRQTLQLVPNMARDPVRFDAPLAKPTRFREAISALHDCVISDLRFKKRDKTAYLEWKKDEGKRDAAIRRAAVQEFQLKMLQQGFAPDLEKQYEQARKRYWDARVQYSAYLRRHDMELWRQLMPCDPVITITEDVALFECFSADESSYGCLSVNRADGFGASDNVQLGTTNVDYSWDLYHHFQSLRSYRDTRFKVDPGGFEAAIGEAPALREEKIDLPGGWLRGFMQLQAAMTMPGGSVPLSREAVYSVIAWLKRHKAKTSPRALRFELIPDQPPKLVLEPWGKEIVSYATRYTGPSVEPIRIWGTRRLIMLARVLPLAERFDVYLLGTGLPSFWVARMGEMNLTLGLSGWTTNDWTSGSNLDLLAPPSAPSPDLVNNVAAVLHKQRAMTIAQVTGALSIDAPAASTALRELARSGQVIFDLPSGIYRWRQIMPRAIGDADRGPENPELAAARQIMEKQRATLETRTEAPGGGYVITGKVDGTQTEILLDADQRIRRGKCPCMYFRRFGLRNGPCRHMLALRWVTSVGALEAYRQSSWYQKLNHR
jgi:hypothetical protein